MANGWVDPFAYEISKEKAGALGRSGEKLERTLAALRSCDSADARREDLIWSATHLVTAIIVQREACGLRDPRHVFEFYQVPREVVARIGVRRVA